MFTTRPGRTFLVIAIGLALLGLIDLAVDGLLYLGRYALPTLIALGGLLRAVSYIAERRGWTNEVRLTRFLSKHHLLDKSRRSS